MIKIKHIVITLIAAGCFNMRVTAQTLSLEQARSLALAGSRTLARYNLAIRNSVLDERAQLYTNFPSLSAGASARIGLWDSGGSPLEKPLDTFSTGMSFGVSQTIFEGGKSIVNRAIKELATESARKDALAEYYRVLDAADSAYYAVLEAAADLEAQESALQAAGLSLSLAEVRQSSGMVNQGEYLKALADMASRETSRNQARRTLALNVAKLKALIGIGENPNPEQIDFGVYEDAIERLANISDRETDTLYGELWTLTAAANPSLAIRGIANQSAEKNLSLTKRNFSPTVNVNFSLGGFDYTPDKGLQISGGSVSVSGNIPLDFWAKANSVEKSAIARDMAALDYLNAAVTLETDLQSALLGTIAQAGTFLSSRRALEYAQKQFEYTMERYRLSQSSVSELSDASALVSSNRNQLIRAQYGFLRSLSTLRSLGALDDEEKLLNILRGYAQ